MNVFEDLIVELQEENLLEQTVIDEVKVEPNTVGEVEPSDGPEPAFETEGFIEVDPSADEDPAIHTTADTDPPVESEPQGAKPAEQKQPKKKDSEFFKKRAVAEVAGLQMVDHVLTGVEREYMKVVPAAFDDFNAKKALNTFLQATGNGQAEAEFALMQETESWCSALAARDARVPVSSLRLYCENSKPALSSQALLALARFYRNLPYSEGVRAKFDFVMTRLFSRPTEDDKRVCLFDRVESLNHINTLYGEWSSVPLYTAEDDESKVLLTALSFEDLAVEAENAANFDQLITSDFFGRLRLFKESISELFFAPNVTASAIEANVRIGNAYVVLIAREREKMDAESIQSKYVGFDDQSVSDATARSLGLVDLLTRGAEPVKVEEPIESGREEEPHNKEFERPAPRQAEIKKKPANKKPVKKDQVGIVERLKENAQNVNRWFLAVAFVLVAASVGIYVWANYFADGRVSTTGVAVVVVDVPGFTEHVKTAKLSNEMLYVHLLATWDAVANKKQLLQQVVQAGEQQGWRKVQLIGIDGKPAGFASPGRLEVPER